MTLTLRLHVLDSAQNDLGLCDAYTALTVVDVYNGVGSFTLTVPTTSAQQGLFGRGGAVAVHQVDGGGNDLQPALFSGKITDLEVTETATDGTLQVDGLSDDAWIAARLIRPDLIGSTTGYDTRTAPAETVIKGFAGSYLLPSEVTIAPDLGRGVSVYSNARYQQLSLIASQLAEYAGIGWSVRSTISALGVRQRVLDCWVPVDRSSSVRFSRAQGSLSASTWKESAASANRAVAAGTGNLTARLLQVANNAQDQSDWAWVYETFVDETAETTTAALLVDAQQALLDAAALGSLQLTAIDLPAQAAYVHYFPGDLVTAYVAGQTIVDRVRQITTTIAAGQPPAVVPVIGSYGADSTDTAAIYKLLRAVSARVTHGQRRS